MRDESLFLPPSLSNWTIWPDARKQAADGGVSTAKAELEGPADSEGRRGLFTALDRGPWAPSAHQASPVRLSGSSQGCQQERPPPTRAFCRGPDLSPSRPGLWPLPTWFLLCPGLVSWRNGVGVCSLVPLLQRSRGGLLPQHGPSRPGGEPLALPLV